MTAPSADSSFYFFSQMFESNLLVFVCANVFGVGAKVETTVDKDEHDSHGAQAETCKQSNEQTNE
jgi:hypothetical protein